MGKWVIEYDDDQTTYKGTRATVIITYDGKNILDLNKDIVNFKFEINQDNPYPMIVVEKTNSLVVGKTEDGRDMVVHFDEGGGFPPIEFDPGDPALMANNHVKDVSEGICKRCGTSKVPEGSPTFCLDCGEDISGKL